MARKQLTALLIPVLLCACLKDDEGLPRPSIPGCGVDGATLEAEVDEESSCFGTGLFAVMADGEFALGGLSINGMSLALTVDSFAIGTHPSTDALNVVLLTVGGTPYHSTEGAPGIIAISTHDAEGKRVKGSFAVQVQGAENGAMKDLNGSFDVFYVEE